VPEETSPEPAFEPSEPLIQKGRRVECTKGGPFYGKRGRVASVWNGVALVYFQTSSIIEATTYFEPVQ